LALLDDPDSSQLDPHHVAIGARGVAATRQAMADAYQRKAAPMDRNQARQTIAVTLGGRHVRGQVWRFDNLAHADRCKALLDTFDPGMTGAVVGAGLLVIAPIEAQAIA